MQPQKCKKCQSENIYQDGILWICPECFFEWEEKNSESEDNLTVESENVVKDSVGQILTSGDTVTVTKELKIKGASSSVKSGTKVKNIRIIDEVDGHNLLCKIDGVGTIHLKSEYVKKIQK